MSSEKRLGSDPIAVQDGHLYTADQICIPSTCAGHVKGILIPQGLLRDRIEKMAYDIRKHYKEGELHLLCLLKGARTFFGDLSASIFKQGSLDSSGRSLELFHHYVQISTYRNCAATGQVKFVADQLTCLKGKDVLIVDDVVESGNTYRHVREWLAQFEPKSVRTVGLLQVRVKGKMPLVDFVGFTGPTEWFVGYGIDYNDRFREVPHVCVLSDEAKKALAV
ncbi:hypothetical protein, conserved [Eimeria necatrix]|uniref:Phosphoribosyltransferase domain-containing protein n=1 Tax=Eimeria necatrix TaxID=51315 RepID=U6MJ72_9EIME|nr:hypothetical protein, conserved [Eimeria necatrix]CDJ64292.1 hypothetical protein, conserved [Eimeria necatrix]